MNKEITPLDKKIRIKDNNSKHNFIEVEDVKLAVQELKERLNNWQDELAPLGQTNKIIKFRNWVDLIGIINKIFGELAKSQEQKE